MRKIGYARVSSPKQVCDHQVLALKGAGCEVIFTDDAVCGAREDRAGLSDALAHAQSGDALVVWKLDRLARSLTYLCRVIDDLAARNVGFISMTDGIDTTTHSGKLVCHILGAIAEFERNIIVERTMLGLESARQSGKHIGRPFKLSECRLRCAHRMVTVKGWDMEDVARLCRVSPLTLRRGFERVGFMSAQ